MLWFISCTAKPNIQAVRESAGHAHKEYLDARLREGKLLLTGSAFGHDAKTRIGSMFIVNLPSFAEVKAFYEAEPFFMAGVYSDVTITAVKKSRWNPAAAEGAEGRGDGPATV